MTKMYMFNGHPMSREAVEYQSGKSLEEALGMEPVAVVAAEPEVPEATTEDVAAAEEVVAPMVEMTDEEREAFIAALDLGDEDQDPGVAPADVPQGIVDETGQGDDPDAAI